MTRSGKRVPSIHPSIVRKMRRVQLGGSVDRWIIYSRRTVVLPFFVGITVFVHNGKGLVPVHINEDKVGHKFGEFAPTRSFKGHAGDKKKKKR